MLDLESPTKDVCFKQVSVKSKGVLGVIGLKRPQALNAISYEMIQCIVNQLSCWEADRQVVAIVIHSCVEKAFSAGGDIKSLHQYFQKYPQQEAVTHAITYFAAEYRLHYLLRHYKKPIIGIGAGYIFGGGLGLFSALDFRVVTSTSQLSMPESAIGLFPDAGMSMLLRVMPNHWSYWVGMSGCRLRAEHAMFLGLASHYSDTLSADDVIEAIVETSLHEAMPYYEAHQVIERALSKVASKSVSDDQSINLDMLLRSIANPNALSSAEVMYASILEVAKQDSWLLQQTQNMTKSSTLSLALIWEQVAHVRTLNGIGDCLRMELDLAYHCLQQGDIHEGIDALLIRKDFQPNWRFASMTDIPRELAKNFFISPWKREEHPLADLV